MFIIKHKLHISQTGWLLERGQNVKKLDFYPCPLLYSLSELVKDKPDVKCWTPIVGYPQAVSHIFVKEAKISENVENGKRIVLKS